MNDYKCRICASTAHDVVLDYGHVALADSFLNAADPLEREPRYPLTLVVCAECMHVQIKEVLDPAILFSDYVWETGIPASIRAYCSEFADAVTTRVHPSGTPSLVEIASNDGTMLQEFKRRGYDVIGVDPAKNIAEKANADGVRTVPDFFGERVARAILAERGPVDLCVARNVIAHVADLQGLMKGIALLLSPEGTAVIEFPHLLTTFAELQYDQVFHEHIGYHGLDSVQRLAAQHGLSVFDVEHAWIHGGSLRCYLAPLSAARPTTPAIDATLREERAAGLYDRGAWQAFGGRVRKQKELLRAELAALRAAGKKVVGYGASGKGQSLIQFCELDTTDVAFIADKSTMKIGKLAPGSHIPVVSPERMRAEAPDVVVLFAWNFAREILEQESELRTTGTRFLHPIPEPHYL